MIKAITVLFVLFAALSGPTAHAAWPGKGGDLMTIFEELDLKGAQAETVKKLAAYVDGNPSAEYIDEALLRLGRIYSDKKELQRAADAYHMLLANFPQSRFRNDAAYELALIDYRTGRIDEARAAFEAISRDKGASLQMRARSARFLKEVEKAAYGLKPQADLPAIGVLLPLKGDYASFGEDALSGVLMAAGVFGDSQGTGGAEVDVIVKDITDASSVWSAVAELASNKRVVGAIGPLMSSTAAEAARHAQTQKLPLITLSQKDGITDAGDYVFRNFLTSEDQARALADYAAGPMAARRFAILHPQSAYGVDLARHFEAAVKAKGGVVVRKASYPQGTMDFSETIKRLFGVQVNERMEGRRKIREFNPTIKVDALFIPDSHEPVALIAPYLDYYNVKGVRLMGPNVWNSPRLVDLAGKNVEGAVFVDGFFAAGESAEGFSRSYGSVFGHAPGTLSAQAFDAARMLLNAASVDADRDGVKERLRSTKEFRGATGDISFNSKREARKKLFILTVEGGRIVEAGN